jgi:hypothetical protein
MGHQRKSRLQERKTRRREERKKRVRVRSVFESSSRGRMRAAGRAPLRQCLLTADWRDHHVATVILSRDGPRGIACAAVHVDLDCLGVKRCIAVDDLDEADYEQLVSSLGEGALLRPGDPALALKLVDAGAAYAAGLGFRPHKAWRLARELFGDADVDACSEEIQCGRDGRPLYVAGPDDDVDAVLSQLEARLGPDGFDFEDGDGDADDDEPEPPLEGNDWEEITDAELALATGVDSATAAAWRRVRCAEGRAVDTINAWARDRYGSTLLDAAIAECLLWRGASSGGGEGSDTDDGGDTPDEDADAYEADAPAPLSGDVIGSLGGMFLPWFCFNWTPDPNGDFEEGWPDVPVALAWLAEHPDADDVTRRFIETACGRPYSFYSVTDAHAGRTMHLRCVLTGSEYEVLERSATLTAARGGVLYARIVPIDGLAVMCGCASLFIPPEWHDGLMALREDLSSGRGALREEHLADLDIEVRHVYVDIAETVLDPPTPRMQNIDGDPLVFTTLAFELRCSPREAFDALKTLAHDQDEEELLFDAVLDGSGEPTSVQIPWSQPGNATDAGWDNTMLGHLAITPGELEVSVNSEARAERIRTILAERLGERARLLSSTVQSADEALREARAQLPTALGAKVREEHAPLMAQPEVRQALKETVEGHWRSWFDESIPALRGQTPREAARTPEGRERLEALLRDYESRSGRFIDPLMAPDVAALRRELGM